MIGLGGFNFLQAQDISPDLSITEEVETKDTLDYIMMDFFRIDKKNSTIVLNYLIRKREITKKEIDEERLNVFNYVYVLNLINPKRINQIGIYKFGIISSHGTTYLLLKEKESIEILSGLEDYKIKQKVEEFLISNSNDIGEQEIHQYRLELEYWFKNKTY